MVYHGRLSKKCLQCRKRKLPCDLRPAPCGQCSRANLDCSGYRDVNQLRIHNQTEDVKAKAFPGVNSRRIGNKGSNAKRLSASSVLDSFRLPSSIEANGNGLIVTSNPSAFENTRLSIWTESGEAERKFGTASSASNIQLPLATPIEDQARNAFFFHYVTNDLRTYSYLHSFYSSGSEPAEKQLGASVNAVSLAFFSHWANSPLALKEGKKQYVSALQHLNDAIRIQGAASKDATLLVALLLDLFEKMTNRVPQSTGAWVSHVKGAFALIQLRDRDQFERPVGIKMLIRLCTNLLISCVASDQPIPTELVYLRSAVAGSMDSNDPKWRLMGLMVRFVELRQAEKSKVASDGFVLDLAESLDQDFVALVESMPPAWQYERVNVKECSDRIYGDHFDIYRDMHVTQTWNVLRLTRIMINEIIRDRSSTAPNPSNGPETLITTLAADICASVPQYTNPSGTSPFQEIEAASNPPEREMAKHPPQSLACYTVLFSLFVAAQSTSRPSSSSSSSSSSGIKPWAIQQLNFMSDVLGMRNAELVARVLDRDGGGGKWVDPWSVYAMLGSYAFVA